MRLRAVSRACGAFPPLLLQLDWGSFALRVDPAHGERLGPLLDSVDDGRLEARPRCCAHAAPVSTSC